MKENEQPISRIKKVLIAFLLAAGMLIPIGALLFELEEVSPELVSGTPQTNKIQTAVVLTWFRSGSLQPGDLVLVELRDGSGKEHAVRKLQKIVPPDPATRQRARGGRGRAVRQAIYDMDFGPTYWVSSDTEGKKTEEMHHTRITGKVIGSFSRKR